MKPECHEGTEEIEKGKQRPNEFPVVIERHTPRSTHWLAGGYFTLFRKCIIFCLLKVSA